MKAQTLTQNTWKGQTAMDAGRWIQACSCRVLLKFVWSGGREAGEPTGIRVPKGIRFKKCWQTTQVALGIARPPPPLAPCPGLQPQAPTRRGGDRRASS